MLENKINKNLLDNILHQLRQDNIQKTVVGAVIFIDEKTPLLLKRKSDDFMGGLVELPSGTLENNEFLIDSLIREIKEETNLDIKSIDYYVDVFDYVSGSGKKTRQINFVVTPENMNIKLSEEHVTFYTYNIESEEFKKLNISSKTKKIIEKAVKIFN